MKNLNWFGLLLLFALLVACEDQTSQSDPYGAIPGNAAMVLKINNTGQSVENFKDTRIFEAFAGLPLVDDFRKQMAQYREAQQGTAHPKLWKDRSLWASVSVRGANKYGILWIAREDPDLRGDLQHLLQNIRHGKEMYSKVEVTEIQEFDPKLYVARTKGLLLLSSSRTLVEQSIRQLQTDYSLLQNPDFRSLRKTASGKDPLNLYLNLQEMPALVNTVLSGSQASLLKRAGSWCELDVQFNQRDLILSGITRFDASHHFSIFNKVEPMQTRGTQIVPATAALWLNHTFQNARQFHRHVREYRENPQSQTKAVDEAVKKWVDITDTEIGIFYTSGKEVRPEPLAYLSLRDEGKAQKFLKTQKDSGFVEGFRAQLIHRLKDGAHLEKAFGRLFHRLDQPYFTVIDGFVILSDELAALKGALSDYLDQNTMEHSASYREFSASLPSTSHVNLIMTNPDLLEHLGSNLNQRTKSLLKDHETALQKIRWGGLQVNVKVGGAYTSLYFKEEQQKQEKVNRAWSTSLDAQPASTPQFLINHYTNQYDVAVQDEDHRLYLLKNNGEILWKKKLDGPIMGDIRQVDLYKNNKLQMAFNTPESLYVVDRLGRDVENFPVELPATATAPAGVFNYDNARRYRFVVPCGDELHNYSKDGAPTEGWQFTTAQSTLISEPQFFSVAGKDIIVCLTADGKLLQLNRRGQERFKLDTRIDELKTSFYLKRYKTLEKSELLANSTSGKIYSINPLGKVDQLYLEKDYPADHFLYFEDKYIFSSGSRLFVKDEEQPFSVALDGDIAAKPKAMLYGGKFYVGVFVKTEEEIHLFNANGKRIKGFPVFAQGPFDMGSLKRNGVLDIVTYSEDGTLICYSVR